MALRYIHFQTLSGLNPTLDASEGTCAELEITGNTVMTLIAEEGTSGVIRIINNNGYTLTINGVEIAVRPEGHTAVGYMRFPSGYEFDTNYCAGGSGNNVAAAPTGGVVDDEANTFTFNLNPLYPASEHEYQINGGAWVTCTSNVIAVGNLDVAIGALLVRVKAATDRDASSALANTAPFTSTFSEVEEEVATYFTAENITNPTLRAAIDTMVKSLKEAVVDGQPVNLFSKFLRLSPYLGATHSYNLVNINTYTADFTGSWLHDDAGSTPTTSSNNVERTGLVPSEALTDPNYTVGAFITGTPNATERYFFGVMDSTTGTATVTRLGWQLDSGVEYIFGNINAWGATAMSGSVGAFTGGHWAIGRNGSVEKKYRNGAVVDTDTVDVSIRIPGLEMYFGCLNNDGGADKFFNGTLKLSYVIKEAVSNAEMTEIHNILSTFLNSIGR